MKINFIDSDSANTIQDTKKETTDKNTSRHLDTHINELSLR